MRTIYRFSCLLLCLLQVSCISSTPAPTQVIIPTSTTHQPTQIITATPTTIPPTKTFIPTATQKSTQTITPTTVSEIFVPGALPEGWHIYQSGSISIGIPPGWTKYDPGFEYTGAWFRLPNNATLLVGMNKSCVCELGCGGKAGDIQKCLADSSEGWIYPDEVRIVSTGEWWDGVHKGDYVEVINETHNKYEIRILALISPEGQQTIEVFYDKEGTASPTDTEREQLRNAISTFQLSPEE